MKNRFPDFLLMTQNGETTADRIKNIIQQQRTCTQNIKSSWRGRGLEVEGGKGKKRSSTKNFS
jgi:hypothetical protein